MKESQHTPTDTPKTALDEHFIDYYLQVTIFRIQGTFNFQKRAGETSTSRPPPPPPPLPPSCTPDM